MQEIVDKYDTDYYSPYLLPILQYPYDNRNQYKNVLYRTNKSLKEIAKMIDHTVLSNTATHDTFVAACEFAKENGSTYIVVGRSITGASDPVEAYKKCVKEFC